MTIIDLASLHAVTGGAKLDAFGAHIGLGNTLPPWTQSLSDAGKIDERDGQRMLQKATQGILGGSAGTKQR